VPRGEIHRRLGRAAGNRLHGSTLTAATTAGSAPSIRTARMPLVARSGSARPPTDRRRRGKPAWLGGESWWTYRIGTERMALDRTGTGATRHRFNESLSAEDSPQRPMALGGAS